MSSNIIQPVVREATPADLAQIVPLFLASLDTSIPGVTFSNEPFYAPDNVFTRLRTRLFPPRSRKTYVLEFPQTGDIVGYGNVKPRHDPDDTSSAPQVSEDQDEVDMFFVKAGAGGRGYGTLLMEAIQKEWSAQGGLKLRVFKKNERAIRFYDKCGFRMVAGGETVIRADTLTGPFEEAVCLMRWSPTP
ncbi:acyl-CoA N-acyltransferase [Cubamyces sp. BRFM 1775]|nr:acyl-CoA N-acyltransferase [Cubamyces sp. BRFM 1775]